MKKVSVIIPTYNSGKYIEECINSVINQTYTNLEIIVVDDCSNDNTLSILKKYKDKRIKLIKLEENKGVSYARNRGIDFSSGEFICFLDSDDYWYLDKIEKQVKFMKDKKCAFSYGSYAYLRGEKTIHIAKVPSSITYKKALGNTTIFTSTVMFDMKKLKKEDIYQSDVKLGGDSLSWWKVLKLGITAYGINDVLSVYRVGNKSLSSNKIRALKRTWKLYKYLNIPFIKKVYYFTCYVINAIKRRVF